MSATSHSLDCKCAICGNHWPFELPLDLLNAFLEDKITIFAGAGISTEGNNVIGHTLYDELKSHLSHKDDKLDFPDLVSRFCARPNGRLNFIKMLNERLRSVRSSPEFYYYATGFHRELGLNSKIQTIVTTNWDNFFERECWATPFVYPEDTAFWTATERRLLKIHGTIENLGSIVASNEDYEDCRQRLSSDLIGSRLKLILSESTVVFCGYSLRDYDFREIMRFVQKQMKGFHRQAYIVTIDKSEASRRRFDELGIVPIYTDATYFMQQIYEQWRNNRCVAPRQLYSAAADLLEIVRNEHIHLSDEIPMQKKPAVIYGLFYQDGLIHALDRIFLHRKTGEYADLHRTRCKIQKYNEFRKKSIRMRRYADTSYIEGYLTALIFAVTFVGTGSKNDLYPPIYFDFKDHYFADFDSYKRHLHRRSEEHVPSKRYAEKIATRYKDADGMVLDHSFTLDGIM